MYVVKPPIIGLQLAHRMGLPRRIAAVPGILPKGSFSIAKAILGSGSPGPTTILPLGLSRQAIRFLLLVAQPGTECAGIGPRNSDHRMVVALLESRGLPAPTRIIF